MCETIRETVHKFEAAGLGKAPFTFLGMERRVGPIDLGNGMSVGAPGQPMGVCDFCGTGIADCYIIRSADDKHSIVGCDCIRKHGDAGLVKVIDPIVREAKNRKARERAAVKRADRRKEEAARNERNRLALASFDMSKLEKFAHPYPGFHTKTLRDWAEFCIQTRNYYTVIKKIRELGL